MRDPEGRKKILRRVGRISRWLFGIGGGVFLLLTFRATWERSQGSPLPQPWAVVAAEVLVLVGLSCLARAWIRLFPDRSIDRSLTAAFYVSQLGRYIPGAIWQVLAQVGFATRAGASLPQASTSFGVFAVVQLAAGATVGAMLGLFGNGVPPGARLVTPLMLSAVLFLRRTWIVWVLGVVGRLAGRSFDDELVPPQSAILRSYRWTLLTLVTNGLAFAVLLGSLGTDGSIPLGLAAFGFAWTVGFVAIPFPSGIGIREAALILTLSHSAPTSLIIAASVSHRLVSMIGEVIMIVASRIGLRQGSQPAHV